MADCPAVAKTGKHRRAEFSEGSGRRVVRCASCYKEFSIVSEGEATAPASEPVELKAEDLPPAPPQPEPVKESRR